MKIDSAGRTQPVDARLGIYRDSSIAGDATAYFDGFTIATDRASAEDNAFGSAGSALPVPTPPLPAPPVPDPGDIDGSGMKLLMPRTAMFTMKIDSAGRTQPVDARLGIYRDSSIAGDATAYFDGFTIATDRASAEDNAFGSAGSALPVPTPPLPAPPVPDPGARDGSSPPSGTPDPSVGQASAPPGECKVPNVMRHRLRAAHLMLKRAGCDTRNAQRVRSSRRDRGRVLRQSADPGTVAPAGTVVRLVVGRGPR
jgi:hypothetical protein